MKDEEIATLKRTQVEKDTNIKQLEKNCERIVKEKKAVEDESNSIKNCYYLYYLLIKSLEDLTSRNVARPHMTLLDHF